MRKKEIIPVEIFAQLQAASDKLMISLREGVVGVPYERWSFPFAPLQAFSNA